MRRTLVTFKEPVFSSFDFFNSQFNNLERELANHHSEEDAQFFETEEAFLAAVDMPGISFSDIHIELEEEKLKVYAERKNPFEKAATVIKKYNQAINLPKNIDQEKINAHYENGVLNLIMPKRADQKAKRKIEVLTGPKPKNWTNFLNFGKSESATIAN